MINKHLHPIAILKILMEQSDEEHILTQPRILELAFLTGMSIPFISEIEHGKKKPSLETIVSIANNKTEQHIFYRVACTSRRKNVCG